MTFNYVFSDENRCFFNDESLFQKYFLCPKSNSFFNFFEDYYDKEYNDERFAPFFESSKSSPTNVNQNVINQFSTYQTTNNSSNRENNQSNKQFPYSDKEILLLMKKNENKNNSNSSDCNYNNKIIEDKEMIEIFLINKQNNSLSPKNDFPIIIDPNKRPPKKENIDIRESIKFSLQNIVNNINDIAKELKLDFKISNIDDLKDFNLLGIKELKLENIFIKLSIISNKKKYFIQEEKKITKSKYSLIEKLLNLTVKKALQKFIDKKPYIILGGKMNFLKNSDSSFENIFKSFEKWEKDKKLNEIQRYIKSKDKKIEKSNQIQPNNSEILENLSIPETNNKNFNKMSNSGPLIEDKKTTACSSDKKNAKKKPGRKSNIDKKKEEKKHDKYAKDNLRKETIRKSLSSFYDKIINPIIQNLKKNGIIVDKEKYKNYLIKPIIPNDVVSFLKELVKFVKEKMRTIFENSKEKNCSGERISSNQEKIKKLYNLCDEKNEKECKQLKYLFDLRFTEVLKIYLNVYTFDQNNEEMKNIFEAFRFEKDFGNDDKKDKRKKIIEQVIKIAEES